MKTFPQVEISSFAAEGGLDMITPPLRLPDGRARSAINFMVDHDGGYSSIPGYDVFVGSSEQAYPDTIGELQFETAVLSSMTNAVGRVPPLQIKGRTSGVRALLWGRYDGSTLDTTYTTTLPGNYLLSNVEGVFEDNEIVYDPLTGLDVGNVANQAQLLPNGTLSERLTLFESFRSQLRSLLIAYINGAKFPGVSYRSYSYPPYLYYAQQAPIVAVFSLSSTTFYVVKANKGTDLTVWKLDLAALAGSRANALNSRWDKLTFEQSGAYADGMKADVFTYDFADGNGTTAFVASGNAKLLRVLAGSATEITTGASPDTPSHVTVHKDRLFVAIGKSLQGSAPGDPTDWTALNGAFELNVGETIVGLQSIIGNQTSAALLVITEKSAYILYGNDATDFALVPYNTEIGGLAGSVKKLGIPIFAGKAGIYAMQPTQAFGGFKDSNLAALVLPWLLARKSQVTASAVLFSKSQYRLYFADKYALYLTFRNGKFAGAMPVLLEHKVLSTCTFVDRDGVEQLLLGTEEGYVLKSDTGTAFIDRPIYAALQLAFSFMRSPRIKKSFRETVLEIIRGVGLTSFSARYDLSFGSVEQHGATSETVENVAYGAHYDDVTYWDSDRRYDSAVQEPVVLDTPGEGENISVSIEQNSAIASPIRLTGVIIHYIKRRLKR